MERTYAQGLAEAARIRAKLIESFGEPRQNKPDGVGLWLVHDRIMAPREPYFIIVELVVQFDELVWRRTGSTGQWNPLSTDWPTVEFPEMDVACWRID
jgi:hypothetical protein